jgi:ParB/RepB/Spo0J family partition protein
MLQPVLVRPRREPGVGDYFELVFGHRRFRAAVLAGLEEVPGIVRDMIDAEVVETQLVENAKREDIHPLEEADGLRLLHETYGFTLEQIAHKITRHVEYVRRRLRLCALVPEVRTMFLAGHLLVGHAELIASLAASIQAKAAEAIGGDDTQPPMGLRNAADEIRRSFLLRLSTAPFQVDDASLLPSAGRCVPDCTKRTGAQGDLFGTAEADDACIDTICFQDKVVASWRREVSSAKKAGREVLKADAKELFTYGDALHWDSPYLRFSDACPQDPKRRTYQDLLGGSAKIFIAKDARGAAVWLIRRSDLADMLARCGHEFKATTASSSKSPRGNAKPPAVSVEREGEQLVLTRCAELLVAKAEKVPLDDTFLRWITEVSLGFLYDAALTVAERRGVKKLEPKNFSGGALRALIVELFAIDDADSRGAVHSDVLKSAASFLKIKLDLKKLEATCEAEVKAKRAGKGAKPKPATTAKKPAKKSRGAK